MLSTFSILPSKIVELQQSMPNSSGHLKAISTIESHQQQQKQQQLVTITPRSTSVNLNCTRSESSSSNQRTGSSSSSSTYHNVTKTTLLRQELNDSSQSSSGESPIPPPAPPCHLLDLNLNLNSTGSESSFCSEIKSKHQQVISKINSIDIVLNEPVAAAAAAAEENEQTSSPSSAAALRAKTARIRRPEDQKRVTMEDIEPMKDLLHDELMKRMSREKPFFKREDKQPKPVVNYLNTTSSAEDVRNFLVAKEFSRKVILMFGELDGAQLFTLNKNDFEKYCGKEEGVRLDSQITVQKSLCGYREKTNELDSILRMRKEKSESMIVH